MTGRVSASSLATGSEGTCTVQFPSYWTQREFPYYWTQRENSRGNLVEAHIATFWVHSSRLPRQRFSSLFAVSRPWDLGVTGLPFRFQSCLPEPASGSGLRCFSHSTSALWWVPDSIHDSPDSKPSSSPVSRLCIQSSFG